MQWHWLVAKFETSLYFTKAPKYVSNYKYYCAYRNAFENLLPNMSKLLWSEHVLKSETGGTFHKITQNNKYTHCTYMYTPARVKYTHTHTQTHTGTLKVYFAKRN